MIEITLLDDKKLKSLFIWTWNKKLIPVMQQGVANDIKQRWKIKSKQVKRFRKNHRGAARRAVRYCQQISLKSLPKVFVGIRDKSFITGAVYTEHDSLLNKSVFI